MIELSEVVVQAGNFRLGPVGLSIARGEHVVLMGPSGAGKSIVLEVIAGFAAPVAGTLRLRGQPAENLAPEHRGCGWVPQALTLFPHVSVLGNMEYGLRARGMSKEERLQRVNTMAQRLGIDHLLDRVPLSLSGGEQQRVALARALVTQSEILLLDEPFSALEPGRRSRLWNLVDELQSELELTVVHVTQDVGHSARWDGRTVIFSHGKIVFDGAVADAVRDGDAELQGVLEELGLPS